MSETALDTAALQQLDGEARRLMDTIDNLRLRGVDSYVELPQIVVVGNQSSGKSSVLEAISTVKFPTKSGVCTRFATELVLRPSPEWKVDAQLYSGPGGPDHDQRPEPLQSFDRSSFGSADMEGIINEARERLGLNANPTGFSSRVLRVKLQGPGIPQLTLVDLPGFYSSETDEQTMDGRHVVEKLAAKYMAQKSSLILAVISAKSDLANQTPLQAAKEHDASRERTMGIITKPDSLEENTNEERQYFRLAQNEDRANRLQLGWHVLRNRGGSPNEARKTNEQRDKDEADFLKSRIWANLDRRNKGVAELRTRLSTVLLNHIRSNLPGVIRGIEDHITRRRDRLIGLGSARNTPEDHRAYLGGIAKGFEGLARDAVRGIYANDGFFGSVGADDASANLRKLRARLRLQNLAFHYVSRFYGASCDILLPDSNQARYNVDRPYYHPPPALVLFVQDFHANQPPRISWKALTRKIEAVAISDRGTELPGSSNPWLAFHLFKEQSTPWQRIAARHIELVLGNVRLFVDELLSHIVHDEHTRWSILAECVEPFFEQAEQALDAKLRELLQHHRGDYAQQLDDDFQTFARGVAGRRVDPTKGRTSVSHYGVDNIIDGMQAYYEVSCPQAFSHAASSMPNLANATDEPSDLCGECYDPGRRELPRS